MINVRLLEKMYQQWCQGRTDCYWAWPDFVALAAQEFSHSEDAIIRELQKHFWFNWQHNS